MDFGDITVLLTGFLVGIAEKSKRLINGFKSYLQIISNASNFTAGSLEKVFNLGITFEAWHELQIVLHKV